MSATWNTRLLEGALSPVRTPQNGPAPSKVVSLSTSSATTSASGSGTKQGKASRG